MLQLITGMKCFHNLFKFSTKFYHILFQLPSLSPTQHVLNLIIQLKLSISIFTRRNEKRDHLVIKITNTIASQYNLNASADENVH